MSSITNVLQLTWLYTIKDYVHIFGRLYVFFDSTANATLEERIRSIKNKIIIDAQIPWREKRKGEFYFMVLPPLKVLLERDKIRTIQLQRPKERAHYAREYVIETYNTLSIMEKKDFNCYFDSSQESVQDEVNTIKSIINYRPDFHIKYFSIAITGFAFSLVCAIGCDW